MKKILFPVCILFSLGLFAQCSYSQTCNVYQEEDVSVSFERAYLDKDYFSRVFFYIDINLKVLGNSKIIRPANHSRYGFCRIQLLDNFGNDLGFESISPRYDGGKTETGMRPSEEKTFTLEFANEPLKSTEYLVLKIPKKTFGNTEPFELKIADFVIKPIKLKTPYGEDEQGKDSSGELSIDKDKLKAVAELRAELLLERHEKEKEQTRQKKLKRICLWIFVGLSTLCCLSLIYFLWCKTAKTGSMYCKSFFRFLPEWKKQNHLHYLILQIVSALACLFWLIAEIGAAVSGCFKTYDDILYAIFFITFWILISLASIWIGYFCIYGIVKLIYNKIIKR